MGSVHANQNWIRANTLNFNRTNFYCVICMWNRFYFRWIYYIYISAVAKRLNPEKMSIKLQDIPSNRKFSALFNGICCKFVSVEEKITRRSLHKTLEFLGGINHCMFFIITRVTSINRNFWLLHWKIWIKNFKKSCS